MIKDQRAGPMIPERAKPTMTSTPKSADLLSRLRDLARAQDGMAAVEFAVLLPFMLLAYLGGVEIGDGVAIDRKVAITTRAVADLASRYTKITDVDMNTILGASSTIIQPYSSTPLAVTVSGVTIDNHGNATIDWSNSINGTAHSKGSAVTLPGTLASSGTYYVWGEVQYNYTPTLGYVMTGTWTLRNQIFMSPRESGKITRSAT
jgi:Flp pilus assembly protein TadG